MQLKEIKYLTNAHMLGCSPVPAGFRIAGARPVADNKTGNCGVLLQNERSGVYALFTGGKGAHLSSVDQSAAIDYMEAARRSAAKQPIKTGYEEHEMQR